jgi:RHS repeat-associated protein
MAMKKRFYSVDGQMVGYEEGGVRKDFLTDHLGSIIAIMDENEVRVFDTRYSAYGRNRWITGTGCGFGWVGTYGYRETSLFHMSHYVRARHYSYVTGGWSTVDPLWPDESAYGYVGGRSTDLVDPSGEVPWACIGACTVAAGCVGGIAYACAPLWGEPEWVDCISEFVQDLPIHSQVGCIAGLAGCFGCVARHLSKCGKKNLCPPAIKNGLQKMVDKACYGQGKRRCHKGTSCAQIISNIALSSACATARIGINVLCYGGGDATHWGEVAKEGKVIANCLFEFNHPNRRPKCHWPGEPKGAI